MTACDTAETILCIASSERSGGVMFGDADGVAAMAGDVSTLLLELGAGHVYLGELRAF
jgi:hypothetical protein